MAPESESRFGQVMGEKEWRAQERVEVANAERFEDEVIERFMKEAISPDAFVSNGTVTQASLKEDRRMIEDFKKSDEYEASNDYEAKVLEFVLQKMFDDGVFGNVVKYVIKTSEVDDVARGFDFYIDLGEGKERILLGIDATVSKNHKILAKKSRPQRVCHRSQQIVPGCEVLHGH